MTLFSIKGKITAANDKTNLVHRFDVPENIKSLTIKYSYSPKTLENREKAVRLIEECFKKYDDEIIGKASDYLPVKNLVTVSVDCNGRYVGAAHRQANEQEHIISREKSSVGFIKTDIEAGEWDIVLNVHYACCEIDYNITVEGESY